ncbi:MAG: helicase, partial [Aeriscardovia aeriphila]|nr:helicase [Aeriscardovia aeriphila]
RRDDRGERGGRRFGDHDDRRFNRSGERNGRSGRGFGGGFSGNGRAEKSDNPFAYGGERNTSRHFARENDERRSRFADEGRVNRDDRGFRRDDRDERGGRRFGNRDDRRFNRDGERSGRNFGGRRDERGGFRRDERGERGGRRFGDRDDRRFNRDGERSGRNFDRRDERGDRNSQHRSGFSTDQLNERFHGDRNRQGTGRPIVRRDDDNRSFSNGPRRNADGTISYPSQNPYTARRPGEPKMPRGMEWSMLSPDDKQRLRGLSKEHAENIGLHILAAYTLEQTDPAAALEHARWVAKQASRVDIARETLGFIAYRQGEYALAERELRTAMRMNGELDYLPFIADCERGLGNPDKAIEVALSEEASHLKGEPKFELMLVFAGAYADKDNFDQALKIVRTLKRVKNLPGEYRMRALQAEQNFLDLAGQVEESEALDDQVAALEDQFAEPDQEDLEAQENLIDTDIQNLSEDDDANLVNLGFTFDQLAAEEDEAARQEREEAWQHRFDEDDTEDDDDDEADGGEARDDTDADDADDESDEADTSDEDDAASDEDESEEEVSDSDDSNDTESTE